MGFPALLSLIFLIIGSLGAYDIAVSSEIIDSSAESQEISFFHPSGMNGFIVYDVNPDAHGPAMRYESRSFDLRAPLGVPVTVDVERFSIQEGAYDLQQFLQKTESNYLEIFSFQNALTYGAKSSLSPLGSGGSDITMVVASANYQASDRFLAKFSTGVAQTVKEQSRSASNLGYGVDLAGFYEIAPGLTFSLAAGYSTNTDHFRDLNADREGNSSWSLTSRLRVKF